MRRCVRGPIQGYRGAHDHRQDRRTDHRHRRNPTASASPSTARPPASPSSPIATANASSPTPRWTTSSKGAVWQRFSSARRCRPPATPGCGSSRCARWWRPTSRSTTSSTMSSTLSIVTSNAGWRILSRANPLSSVAMTDTGPRDRSPRRAAAALGVLRRRRRRLRAQPIARGPWGQTISGNYVGGILGHVLERDAGDPDFQPARLTVDLFRPAALAPVRVDTTVTRQGRRLRLVDAVMTQGRHRRRPRERTVPAPRRAAGRRDLDDAGRPCRPCPPTPDPIPRAWPCWCGPTATTTTPPDPASGSAPGNTPGPKYIWVRDIRPLIDGEPLTPFTRAAMAGDMASSLTHYGTGGLQFINADYTLTLSRLPEGPYLGPGGADPLQPCRGGDRCRHDRRPARPDRQRRRHRVVESRLRPADPYCARRD